MKRGRLTTLLTVIIIVLLGVGAYFYLTKHTSLGSGSVIKDRGSNVSDYSAVFLTNGQVYFGKVMSNTSAVVDLQDIYYLQVDQQIQPENKDKTSSQQPNVVLVKLGQELHGPNDRMQINKQQVLFIESLKNDSKVVKAIKDNQSK